jgi:hypothetical protein
VTENTYCADNGFGEGGNAIVNQAGVIVGEGTCSVEQNWVVFQTLESCGQASPLTASNVQAANAGSQATVLAALVSSALFMTCALGYWRMRKRNGFKCQGCSCWDREANAQGHGASVGAITDVWSQDVTSVTSSRSGTDGWDEPVLEEMPEDGLDTLGLEVDMEVDIAVIRGLPANIADVGGHMDTELTDVATDDDPEMERDTAKIAPHISWEL